MNIKLKLFIIYDYYGELKLLPDNYIHNSMLQSFSLV